MPRRAASIGRPSDYVVGEFPDGQVAADAPVGVAEIVEGARRLRDYLERTDISVSELSRAAGVNRTTVHAVLAGRAYMEVVTLARLEAATGEQLWGAFGDG